MKLAVIGVGLLGGSAALAWRKAGVATHVIGYDRDPQALEYAAAHVVIDQAAPNLAACVSSADVILLATPLGVMADVLAQAKTHAPAHAIWTDVGSCKEAVLTAAQQRLGAAYPRFIAAHPIAGSERDGVAAARADLFADKLLITTPTTETDAKALAQIESAWCRCGMRVMQMTAAEHDQIFAAVSHLPHLLAFALVNQLAASPHTANWPQYGGGGWRDFTRIAGSNSIMWRDIALANRAPILAALRDYVGQLALVEKALNQGDGAALEALFAKASAARRASRDE